MKRIISLIIIVLTISLTYGQEGLVNLEDIFQKAVSQHKSGNYLDAIENYSKLLEFDIDKEIKRQVLIKRGLAYNGDKNYDYAIIDFTESIKLDSTDMASFIDRGLAYYNKRELDSAEIDFNYVREKNENIRMYENATYWLTKIEFNRKDYKKAIEYCDELIKNNKNDAEFYFLRGTAYSNSLKYKKAINDYDEALKINPNYVQSLTNRGVAKINLLTTNGNLKPKKKETKSACEDLQKAYELGDTLNTEDLIFIYCK